MTTLSVEITIPAPLSKTSPSAPASVATHAVPVDIASKSDKDSPSIKLGKKNTSAICIIATLISKSVSDPHQINLSFPRLEKLFSSVGFIGPSPTITSLQLLVIV